MFVIGCVMVILWFTDFGFTLLVCLWFRLLLFWIFCGVLVVIDICNGVFALFGDFLLWLIVCVCCLVWLRWFIVTGLTLL